MKNFFDNVAKVFKKAVNILMFLVTIGLIVISLPKERKFQYEIVKGKFWQYDDLYAPFSFAINKSESDLEKEYTEIRNDVKPYFKVKQKVQEDKLESYKSLFYNFWEDKHQGYLTSKGMDDPTLKHTMFQYSDNLLNNVYNRGILSAGDFNKYIPDRENVVLVSDQIGSTVPAASIFTQKSAYQYINTIIKSDKDSLLENYGFNSDFFKKINLDNFINVNLIYDEEKVSKEIKVGIEGVALSKGMIQQDERVISKGERIDESKYQELISMKSEYEQRYGSSTTYYILITGQIFIISAFLFLLYFFLRLYSPDTFKSLRKMMFILIQIAIFSIASAFIVKTYPKAIYVIPFAIIPILIINFFDSLTAIFTYTIAVLIVGFIVSDSYQFVFLQFMIGALAVFSTGRLFRRAQLVLTTLLVLLGYTLVYTAYRIIGDGTFEVFNEEYFIYLGFFALNALFVNLSYPLIYMFEKSFGFLSDITLIELSNTNLPVLRELAEKAPGTFQHTLQVANLAEGAANVVKAHPLLTRTGALYHDIGKLYRPEFFTENQAEQYNKKEYTHQESASIIIDHVIKGRERARKINLPKQIADFIVTHHGTGKTLYFYRSFRNENPGVEIDEKMFTYPGPKPYSKETAILMMADAIEAASRSLKEYNQETLGGLVDKIIEHQKNDGQFDNVDLTFRDITNLKEFFTDKLMNIYHTRIAYPK